MISTSEFQGSCIPSGQLNLIYKSRTIWRDLATWMRAYLVSIYAGFGNQEAVKEKLNNIPIEFKNIFSTIFGDQIADTYSTLLSSYITSFESLVTAQINGDANAVNEYTRQLYENADQRAAFLSKINPFWVETEWKNFLYQFNKMSIDESTTFLNKEYTRNIDVFDRILNFSSAMGDYYSQGLINYLTYSGRQMGPVK
jgi:hypothetical protein